MKNKSFLIQNTKSKVILGGQVEKKGRRLLWRLQTSDNNSKTIITKDKKTIYLNDIQIILHNTLPLHKRIIFVNKGIEKIDEGKVFNRIEFVNIPISRKSNRFFLWQQSLKKERLANAISDLYQQESEEIENFTKSAERLIVKLNEKEREKVTHS